jgi:hypothetical protein
MSALSRGGAMTDRCRCSARLDGVSKVSRGHRTSTALGIDGAV